MQTGTLVAAIAAVLGLLAAPLAAWMSLSNQVTAVSVKLDQYEEHARENISRFYTDRFNPLVRDVAVLVGRVATIEAWISARNERKD